MSSSRSMQADIAAGIVVARNIGRITGQQIADDLIDRIIPFFFQCVIDIFKNHGGNGLFFAAVFA